MKHVFLLADVEDALEVDEPADEVGHTPDGLQIDDGDRLCAVSASRWR